MVLGLALSAQSLIGTASATPPPTFTLRPGTQQLEVLDASPGLRLRLLHHGAIVHTGTVDSQGSLMWRRLTAGRYAVQTTDASYTSGTVRVTGMNAAPPPQSFYDAQTLDNGFGFITTRDGTTLSADVSFPSFGSPPYPTVVEYSGYDPSRPGTEEDPNAFAQLFNNLGYAYVGVNIRGTGCSGGSFLPFEPVQSLDGYDAIETIAAQPWVKSHKVGMVGISYPGIEQLYVARTRPPHLSAITPLSVIDDSYRGTLWPGGILNTGFAEPWASERASDARPFGEGWEHGVNSPECDANQLVRLQNPDPVALIEDNPFYNRSYYRRIDPSRFVHRINVPVYLAGAWQDEQTGGHFPAFLRKFRRSPQFYATMSNGSHTEALSLGEFGRYSDFIDIYVAHRVPGVLKQFVAPVLAKSITGVSGLSLPPGPSYSGLNYRQAKRKFEAQKHIRVLFEEGAAKGEPSGAPLPRFEHSFTVVAAAVAAPGALLPDARWPAGHPSGPPREGALVLGRPVGTAEDGLPRQQRRHLGTASGVPLEADPEGHRSRVDHGADEADQGRGRGRLARRLGEDAGQGRRPRGDGQRRTPERPRGLRPERLAARQPPHAREVLDDPAAGAHGPAARRPADAGGEVPAAAHRDPGVRPAVPPGRPAADHPGRARRGEAVVGVPHARPRPTGDGRRRPPPPVVVRADDRAGHPRAEEGAAVPLVAVAAVPDVPRLARHRIETER